MRLIPYTFCIFLCFLTGCGFHLRGMVEMPQWLNNVSIVMQNSHRELEPLLSAQLQTYRISIAPDPSVATYWLIIEEDNFQQQITSISSSTTPRQYQLTYKVRFKLQRLKGEEIMPSKSVIVTRQITINNDRILGSTNEEEQSKLEMQREAAIQIIARLSHATMSPAREH